MVSLLQRRREIMQLIKKERNGYVDGTYTNGNSSWSVSNNVISISSLSGSYGNRMKILFKEGLNIQTGDTVRVLAQRTSGSISGIYYVDVWVGGNKIVNNKLWNKTATALDQSLASPGNSNSLYVEINNRTGDKTYTNYKCTVKIFVNGVQVLPEL